jgi:hypothetical protein
VFNSIGVRVYHDLDVENTVSMGHLEQGVYFIRIVTEQGAVYSAKVMKR